jgi:Fe2+ or Zn2+ uptake regulation protein
VATGDVGEIPTSDLHDDAAARLAARDLRYTTARRALVDVLAVADRPVTLPQILAADPGL